MSWAELEVLTEVLPGKIQEMGDYIRGREHMTGRPEDASDRFDTLD